MKRSFGGRIETANYVGPINTSPTGDPSLFALCSVGAGAQSATFYLSLDEVTEFYGKHLLITISDEF